MFRVLACDMDGTLLRDDKTVSEETLAELRRLTDIGVLFLPSTGRTHKELPIALRGQPFIKYALCCNGGAVYDYEKDRYIYENAIPFTTALEVLEYAKDLPVYESVVINGERIAQGDGHGVVCEYIRKVAVKDILFNFKGETDVKKAFFDRHMDAQKLLLYLKEGADRQETIDKLRSVFPQLEISSSGPLFIEVNIKGVDKGKALTEFCSLMDVPIEESIAFGDAENDISMLKAAGMAVVMENGTEKAKQYADAICLSNNYDGVRRFCEDLWK